MVECVYPISDRVFAVRKAAQLLDIRGCTLGGNFHLFKDRKSVILGVWAAPGAPETLPKGGGLRPPPFARVAGAAGASQTPKMADFRSLRLF